MNDDQLYRSIQSIGMGCFTKYFEVFSDFEKSDEDLIEALMKIEGMKRMEQKLEFPKLAEFFGKTALKML